MSFTNFVTGLLERVLKRADPVVVVTVDRQRMMGRLDARVASVRTQVVQRGGRFELVDGPEADSVEELFPEGRAGVDDRWPAMVEVVVRGCLRQLTSDGPYGRPRVVFVIGGDIDERFGDDEREVFRREALAAGARQVEFWQGSATRPAGAD